MAATCVGIGICLLMLFYHIVVRINSERVHSMAKLAAKQTTDRIKDATKAGWQDEDVKMMLTSGAFLGHLNMISWLAKLNRGKFATPQDALNEYRALCTLENVTLEEVYQRLDIRQKDFKDDMFHATCVLMKLLERNKGVK